jgi:outer membrane protein TolC
MAQARSEAARSRVGLRALVAASDTATRALATAVEQLASRSRTTMDALSFLPAPTVDSLLAVSASVQLADVGVQEAESRLRLTLAEQRTRMTASVGVQRFGAEDGHEIGPTLGASLTLPFTAGGAARANRQAAERGVAAAQAERRAAQLNARAALEGSRSRYEAAVANAALFETALMRGAREERENALASYRTGAFSLLELLDFERALVQAEISQSRSRMAAADAYADLVAGAAEMPEHPTSTGVPPGGES